MNRVTTTRNHTNRSSGHIIYRIKKHITLILFVAFFVFMFHDAYSKSKAEIALDAALSGNETTAVIDYNTALAENPNDFVSAANCAILLGRTGQDDKAEAMFRKALGLDNNRVVNTAFAEFLLNRNRAQEALPYAERGGNDPHGYGGVILGKIDIALGKNEEAIHAFTNALVNNEHLDQAFDDLIPLLMADGNYETAAKYLRGALTDFPEPGALYWYGVISEKKNDVTTAIREYAHYIELYPRGKYRSKCIDRLKELKPAVDYDAAVNRRLQEYLRIPADAMGDRVLVAGRRWVYNVKWKFLHLGTMDVETIEKTTINNEPVWHLRYILKSNPSIPLVKIDDTYETYVDPAFRYTHRYFLISNKNSLLDRKFYDFSLEQGWFHARSTDDDGILFYVEKDLPFDLYDGISVLTWARLIVSKNKPGRAITVVDEDYKYSTILPGITDDDISINGHHYHTRTFNAQINYVGIAGLTGKAVGWITADSESLPVRALFEITIGSIELKLDRVEGK